MQTSMRVDHMQKSGITFLSANRIYVSYITYVNMCPVDTCGQNMDGNDKTVALCASMVFLISSLEGDLES